MCAVERRGVFSKSDCFSASHRASPEEGQTSLVWLLRHNAINSWMLPSRGRIISAYQLHRSTHGIERVQRGDPGLSATDIASSHVHTDGATDLSIGSALKPAPPCR